MRHDPEANRLFLEILTSKNDAETVLRRMNEAGVLGEFVHAFGRIVAMMQFNMYHHYTVDEHLIRCIGELAAIERGENPALAFASELMRTIQPQHRAVLYVAMFLHDIAKGRIEDHSIAGARIARRLCPRLGFSPADTDLSPGWSKSISSCRRWRSRATCPTARRSRTSPPWCNRWSG